MTATKTPQTCIFDSEKQYFCTLSHLLTFWRRSRSFYDMKWPVLQLCGRRQHMMTIVQFCLHISQSWFQFNSRIVRTHFSSKKTLNNWKIIAETRSYIFRLRSRFRRGNHASRAARILPNICEVLWIRTTWNHQIILWGFDDNISMQLRIFHSLFSPEIPRSNSFLGYFA